MQEVSFYIAFGAGLFSFLSPCVLPLIPVFFASMAGSTAAAGGHRLTLFFHSLSFVLGFTAAFTLLGAGVGLLGLAVSEYIVIIRQIAGVLMVLMGVILLLALKVPWLNFEKRISAGNSAVGKTGYLRSFVTGGVFALGWTPCVGPILGGILALALGSGTALTGAYLLVIYSLGLGLPFLVIGFAFDGLRRYLTGLQRYSAVIHIVSGILLISVGILVYMDKLALLSISV